MQVAFAIDVKLSDTHERAFAEHGGPRKMGFVRAIATANTKKSLEKLVGRSMMRPLPDKEEFRAARKEEAEAFTEVNSLRIVAERVTGKARRSDPAVAALGVAEERLQVARYTLNTYEVRPLACFEQTELLDEAIREARRSLIVTSAGIQPSIVNGIRLRELDKLAAAGARVEIETLLTPQEEPRGSDHYDPLAELTRRAKKDLLTIRKGQRQDFFFLIQDDELAVVSNRPFLGEVARRSGFTCVEGIVTRRAEFVQEVRRIALASQEAVRRAR